LINLKGVQGVLEGLGKLDKPTITKILHKLRHLFKDTYYNDNIVFDGIAGLSPSESMVFPCDVIDLRKILSNKEIEFDDYIPLFSQKFAEKFLKQYSLFLIIDTRKVDKDSFRHGGLCILRDNKLNVEKSLSRIIINKYDRDNTVFDVVSNIVDELGIYVECVVSNSIPGISPPIPKLSERKKNIVREIVMENNWYNKIKKSQTIPDGCIGDVDDPEIHKGPSPIESKYRRGMRVRDRRRGVANPQEFGIVDSVRGNLIEIVWSPNDKKNKRVEKFDAVEDTEKLSLIVAEV